MGAGSPPLTTARAACALLRARPGLWWLPGWVGSLSAAWTALEPPAPPARWIWTAVTVAVVLPAVLAGYTGTLAAAVQGAAVGPGTFWVCAWRHRRAGWRATALLISGTAGGIALLAGLIAAWRALGPGWGLLVYGLGLASLTAAAVGSVWATGALVFQQATWRQALRTGGWGLRRQAGATLALLGGFLLVDGALWAATGWLAHWGGPAGLALGLALQATVGLGLGAGTVTWYTTRQADRGAAP